MDMARFYTKWALDIRDAQSTEGAFSDVSPNPFAPKGMFLGAPGWGDAGVIVPWRMYENYGDLTLLTEHFAAAEAWVEFIRRENPDLIWRNRRGNDYGDWLNADTFILENWPSSGGQVPKEVYATAFFAHSTDLLARMAAVLGDAERTARYRELFGQIREAFNAAFVSEDGRIQGDTQAGYALALHFGLLPERLQPTAVDYILEGIERYGGRLSTGIQSTHRMMIELARRGRAGEAYRLLLSRVMPSWGYMVDQGATTIWERWDGYVEGRGFQKPTMNSFNHVAIGAVGEWLYRCMAGINLDENQPAYKHTLIRPVPGGGISYASAEYDSIHGKLLSSWRVEGDAFHLAVAIPGNTMATVYLPCQTARDAQEGGRPLDRSEGVEVLGVVDGALAVRVGAGRYEFTARMAPA
jgi:alpha-L-rhamnosidase